MSISLAMVSLFCAVGPLAHPVFAEDAGLGAVPVLRLGAAVSALISEIGVHDHEMVQAGQVLLKFDCKPLEAGIKLREADLEAAQAAYGRTRNGPRPDEIAIGEAYVGVAQARADEAQAAYGRATALREGVTTTLALVLQARRDARISAAQLEDAQKKLDLLHAGSRQEDIDEAAAKRDAARASLDEARARLDYCSLKAPVAGMVKILVTRGQFISTAVPVTLIELTPARPF